jgi:Sec-independent protein secretion pathway component TatC
MAIPRRLGHAEEATLGEHLEELRGRLFVVLGTVVLGTVVAYVFHDHVLNWLNRPLPADHHRLSTFGVAEPFTVTLTVSLYAGFVLALPSSIWQIWLFFAPALDPAPSARCSASPPAPSSSAQPVSPSATGSSCRAPSTSSRTTTTSISGS